MTARGPAGNLVALAAALALSGAAAAQSLTFQDADRDEPVAMAEEQLAQLGDPLFRLVIRDHPEAVRLDQIEALIQPDAARRQTFVVSERIHQDGGPETVRSVRAFTGQTPDGIDVHGKVFLSLFIAPGAASFPETGPVEALAWDGGQGVYNYYKLDRRPGDDALTWRFRGSSRDADLRSDAARADTCFACHITGAPVMKELLVPWNNWHSASDPIAGLASPVDSLRWPIARRNGGDPRAARQLLGAEELELTIVGAIERFNRGRLEALKGAPGADGRITIRDARRALRPLFETVELNLISARQKSGLHPFGADNPGQPGEPVCAPNSSFVNAGLIGGMNGIAGLKIAEARQFQRTSESSECARNPLAIGPAEYRDLLIGADQSLGDARPGDVAFAWLTPEPAFVDNDMVDLLMSEGAITPQLVAAVLAVDLETPVLSETRAALLPFVPDSFAYEPLQGADPLTAARHPDALTQAVIANLEAFEPEPDDPAASLLELLRQDDPVAELRRRVVELRDGLIAALDPATTTPAARQAALMRLHGAVRERYAKMQTQLPFSNLVESTVLLPK